MLKIISTKPRTYRVKRKAVKPRKRLSLPKSITKFFIKLVIFTCPLIAFPLLLIALPFVGLGIFLIALAFVLMESLGDMERGQND